MPINVRSVEEIANEYQMRSATGKNEQQKYTTCSHPTLNTFITSSPK